MTNPESRESLCLHFLWDWLKEQQSLLRSPFFPVLFSLTVYLSCCLPYACLDLLCSRLHVCFIFPISVLYWYWKPVFFPPLAPDMLSVVRDILACLLLFDMQYFFWHLLHHKVTWLYNSFHKDVWELLSLSLFSTLNPALLGCHPLTEMLFFITNIYLSVEAHSGYEFPWSPRRLVPFGLYGGAHHHDLHHLRFKVNYAPYFTHWDRLFGTLLGPDTKRASSNTNTFKRM
ncbi:hypothetical protein Q5P01_021565 [Channa striata]|uniref:Fatty acid hydroxylase domain-containing protein n=1 Tax=Channa striata TaxID=64152 RepID=A0AA88RYI3_CHASR|nr:hypothetical protein Q5P01_021565 [Channa striata]